MTSRSCIYYIHSIIYYYCAANIICRTSDRQDSMRTALIYSTRLPIHTTIGMPTPGQTSINYRPSNYDVPLLLTNASSTTSDTLLYNTLYIIGIIYYYYCTNALHRLIDIGNVARTGRYILIPCPSKQISLNRTVASTIIIVYQYLYHIIVTPCLT